MEASQVLMDVMGCRESPGLMVFMAAMVWMVSQDWMGSLAHQGLLGYPAPMAAMETRELWGPRGR